MLQAIDSIVRILQVFTFYLKGVCVEHFLYRIVDIL